jgi:hypothetical protein
MPGFFCSIGQNLVAHAEAYGVGAGALLVAAGKCMPKSFPKSFQDLWSWAYETVQTVIPTPRNPTLPIESAKQAIK